MSVLPEMLKLVLEAASYVATTVPAAVFKTIVPVPFAMSSLKVQTMLLETATPVASSAGLKAVTVGLVVSAVAI